MAYTQKTWEKDDLIEASDLNNIEQGIKDNENDISTLEDRATEDEDNVATLENLVNANKEELDNTIEQNAKDDDVRLTSLEQRADANDIEVEDKVPKCTTSSEGYTGDVHTAGYLTNSNTHVYFMIPITDRDRKIRDITVNSLQIRQNWSGNSGNGYLVGTSSSSADFEGVASIAQGPFGTRIRFSFHTDDGGPGSIGGINNNPVGVTANMTITFEDPEPESSDEPDEGSDDDN